MSSTALAKADKGGFAISKYDMPFEKFVEMAYKSGSYPDVQTAQHAVMKIIYGHALGIDPATALTSINLIKGKPTMSANLMASRVNTSGTYYYEVVKKTDSECSLQFYKLLDDWTSEGKQYKRWIKPGPPETFTLKMADRAGLAKNDNWKKYPEAMLFARCLSAGVRTYCPEVMNGIPVYTPDEMDPSVQYQMVDNELVPVQVEVVQSPPKTTATPQPNLENEVRRLLKETETEEGPFLKKQFGFERVEQLSVLDMEKAIQVLRVKATAPKMAVQK